jgi:ABC-type Na+ efflux pump permease subunit
MYIEGRKASRPMMIIAKILGWVFILLLALGLGSVLAGMLFGCNSHCEQCTQTMTVNKSLPGYPIVTTFEACGDDLKDVDGKTFKTTSGTLTITTTISCK